MNNTSIGQLERQIITANKQSKRDPYRYETNDTSIDNGNSLSDLMSIKKVSKSNGRQGIPPLVKEKIETIFANHELQYKLLGLYYAGYFTIDEIADIESMQRDSVSRSLKRAVNRLRKYLTAAEYDSIRWILRDYKRIPSNLTVTDRSYETTYTCQDRKQFPYHESKL